MYIWYTISSELDKTLHLKVGFGANATAEHGLGAHLSLIGPWVCGG